MSFLLGEKDFDDSLEDLLHGALEILCVHFQTEIKFLYLSVNPYKGF